MNWDHILSNPVLPVLPKPCGDCAVEWGFYECYSEELAKETEEVKFEVSRRWSCHNANHRACRGNWNYQKLAEQEERAGIR